jgi:hypothetical protein
MPDYGPEALQAAADAMQQREHILGENPWRENAGAALDAAAPLLAEDVARKILAHMEEYWPLPAVGNCAAIRRHLRMAAQIAAGAFTTEAEMKQQAAEALAAALETPAPDG